MYGHPDNSIGSGASFAIESWAGYGIGQGPEAESHNFWKELIVGLEAYNAQHRKKPGDPPVDTSFFQFHFDLELGHVANVEDELAEVFFTSGIDEEKWYQGALRALDSILVFWQGLDERRKGFT